MKLQQWMMCFVFLHCDSFTLFFFFVFGLSKSYQQFYNNSLGCFGLDIYNQENVEIKQIMERRIISCDWDKNRSNVIKKKILEYLDRLLLVHFSILIFFVYIFWLYFFLLEMDIKSIVLLLWLNTKQSFFLF